MRSSLFAVLLLTAITYTPAHADDTDGHNYVNGLCTANHDCSARYVMDKGTAPTKDGNIYQLNSAQDFFYFAEMVRQGGSNNSSVKSQLNVDVDLSLLWKNSSTKTSWTPIGTSSIPFKGTFDGGGHSIKNLYINNSSLEYVGLFGYLTEATISNLYVKVSDVASLSGSTSSVSYGGVIAGLATYSTFTNCNTYATSLTTYCTIFGGIVGSIQNGTIENCHNLTTVNSRPQKALRLPLQIGGIVGVSNPATLTHCFNQGKITITLKTTGYDVMCGGIGGSVGTESTFTRCYASAPIYKPAASYVTSSKLGLFAGYTKGTSTTYSECYSLLSNESGTVESTLIGSSTAENSGLTMLRPSSSSNTDYAYDYTVFGSSVLCDDEGGIHNEYILNTDGANYIDNVVYYDAEENAYKVKKLVLTDGTPYKAEHDYTAESFSFNRSITENNTISMVLPVTVNSTPDGCPLYKLSAIDTENNTLVFKSATSITANCPYLIVAPTTEELSLTASNVANNCNGEVTNAMSNGSITVTHTGTYLPQTYTADDTYTYYGYKDGEFLKAKKSHLKPFRTMLRYTSTDTSSDASTAPLAFKVSLDGETTGIVSPTLETRTVEVYDLSGRQLRSTVNSATALRGLPRGIYIVGGQKVIKQ